MSAEVVRLVDAETHSQAWIAPSVGFNCFRWRDVIDGQGVEIIDAPHDFAEGRAKPSSAGIPILFPFPNRIRNATYTWEGKTYTLEKNNGENAIHGFCYDRPWRVVSQSENHVTGRFQLGVDAPDRKNLWPSDFLIEVSYELMPHRLRANFRIVNVGNEPMPWGLGTHPYFHLPLSETSRVEDCLIEVPVTRQWKLVNCLPTGDIVTVPEEKNLFDGAYVTTLKLDDVYTGLEYEGPQFDSSVMDEAAGFQVTQTCPPIFREVVVYTPPGRPSICIEPYTCVTDAINLRTNNIETGLRILSPGSEFHTWIDLSVSRVLA